MMRIKNVKSDNGFTLVEALIAMVVLSIGIFSLYSMQVTSIQGNSKASHITTASVWNADLVERIIGTPYEDIGADKLILDSDGDGVADMSIKDTDGNGDGTSMGSDGNDTNLIDFGLDESTTATADGNFVSSDGHYTILWNVAIDVPVPAVKTIRVHVVDNQQLLMRPVTFTYFKTGSM